MSRLSKQSMHTEARELAAGYLANDLTARRTLSQYVAKPAQRKLGVLLLVGYHLAKQDVAVHGRFVTETLNQIAG